MGATARFLVKPLEAFERERSVEMGLERSGVIQVEWFFGRERGPQAGEGLWEMVRDGRGGIRRKRGCTGRGRVNLWVEKGATAEGEAGREGRAGPAEQSR